MKSLGIDFSADGGGAEKKDGRGSGICGFCCSAQDVFIDLVQKFQSAVTFRYNLPFSSLQVKRR